MLQPVGESSTMDVMADLDSTEERKVATDQSWRETAQFGGFAANSESINI